MCRLAAPCGPKGLLLRTSSYRFASVLALAAAIALAGCGGDDDLVPAGDKPSSEPPAQAAEPPTSARLVSETLREFRRRYESRDPRACELVTSSFKPSPSSRPSECESAVEGHRLAYAVVALSREGNRVGDRSAMVMATLRRDDADGGTPRRSTAGSGCARRDRPG